MSSLDKERVCPICCENLDEADKQFFPCICGYQVCMFCWNKLRETYDGKCPGCRAPYGDKTYKPHEVKKDLNAAVSPTAAEAKQGSKQPLSAQQQQQQQQQPGVHLVAKHRGGRVASGSRHVFGAPLTGAALPPSDSPALVQQREREVDPRAAAANEKLRSGIPNRRMTAQDRKKLAAMRVIQRNLVYVIGIPPSLASEEKLRRREFFGQYGKVVKVGAGGVEVWRWWCGDGGGGRLPPPPPPSP